MAPSGLYRVNFRYLLAILISVNPENDKNQKKLLQRIRKKFRLVIVNDETFEERWSMRLSLLNIVTWVGFTTILLIIGTYAIVAYTPVRTFVPGYPDPNEEHKRRAQAVDDSLKIIAQSDSLVKFEKYTETLLTIMRGGVPKEDSLGPIDVNDSTAKNYKEIEFEKSEEDSLLRAKIKAEDQYTVGLENTSANQENSMQGVFFFSPLQGDISRSFNTEKSHFGIDIIAPKNQMIKSTLDGTVILAAWTSDDGHVIQVQHSNNLTSIYKHNSSLLKKTGDRIKAGDPIAIIGNSGKLTDGPHLHFELWHNGRPIDPQKYIVFK
jgi:hypothetical protein